MPFAASAASGAVVFDGSGPGQKFVSSLAPHIYFDDAVTSMTGPYQINQFDISYENISKATANFDVLVQFYNNVNYGAATGDPVGTMPIGGLVHITGLSAAGGDVGQTGLVSLPGDLRIGSSGTIGYEIEFVTPGTTNFSVSNLSPSLLPVFNQAAPIVGTSSPYFAYDYLDRNGIVGDSSSGDVFTFTKFSTIDAQIGAAAAAEINVASGQNYVINAATGPGVSVKTIAGINIAAGGNLTVASASNQSNRQLVIVTSPGLSLAGTTGNWTGSLDLTNNDLDLPNASLPTVFDQIHQGFANGNWNDSGGLVSSTAASNSLLALGVIQNNQGGSPLFTKFDGASVGASDILVKTTYYGDADLSGYVDGSDYSRIDNGYLSNGFLTGWFNGDFNYDGVINGSDYTLIDNAFNSQGASLAASVSPAAVSTSELAPSSAVPEPATLSLLAVASVGALTRRKRINVTIR